MLFRSIGSAVSFPVVLTADDKGIKVGKEVEKIKVTCEVVAQGKEKKIIVFKYKAKKNERKKQGHRQPYTQLKVTAIGEATAPAKKSAEPKAEPAAKKPAAAKTAAPKATTATKKAAKAE